MKNLNSYSILENVKKKLFSLKLNKVWAEISVSITATLTWNSQLNQDLAKEIKINLKRKNFVALRDLIIVSWCLPDEVRVILQENLIKQTRKVEFLDLRLLLKSREFFHLWLVEQASRKGPEHLFGNILESNRLLDAINSIQLKILNPNLGPNSPEKARIGVGYRDKGKLPDPVKSGMKKQILHRTQERIEKERDSADDLAAFIEGFLM